MPWLQCLACAQLEEMAEEKRTLTAQGQASSHEVERLGSALTAAQAELGSARAQLEERSLAVAHLEAERTARSKAQVRPHARARRTRAYIYACGSLRTLTRRSPFAHSPIHISLR